MDFSSRIGQLGTYDFNYFLKTEIVPKYHIYLEKVL